MKHLHRFFHQVASDPRSQLNRILAGASCGFIGLLMVFGAEHLLNQSLAGELLALTGLLLIGCGVIVLLFGYIGLSAARLYKDPHDHNH